MGIWYYRPNKLRKVRSLFSQCDKVTKYANCVGGVTGDDIIAVLWIDHFNHLYNSVQDKYKYKYVISTAPLIPIVTSGALTTVSSHKRLQNETFSGAF